MPFKKMCFETIFSLVFFINYIICDEELLQMELPFKRNQLNELADQICADLFYMDDSAVMSCKQRFSSKPTKISPVPRRLEIKCRTKKKVTIKVEPSKYWQLVVLLPKEEDSITNHILFEPEEVYGSSYTSPEDTYFIWSTLLADDGAPIAWTKHSTILPWNGTVINKPYEIKFIMPFTEYDNSSNYVSGFFSWTSDSSDSCFSVTNHCEKLELGDFFEKSLGPDSNNSVVIENIPIDDDCVFILEGATGLTELPYHSPSCAELNNCSPPISIVQDVAIVAAANSNDSWQVRVTWTQPGSAPDQYNVSLTADEVYWFTLPGNATEAVFDSVKGEGLYYVSVVGISAIGNAHTTTTAMFPVLVREKAHMDNVMAGAWSIVIVAAAFFALTVHWYRKKRKAKLHSYFLDLEDKFNKECSDMSALESVVFEDCWEIRPERLLLHEVIGEGAFGIVRRGTLAPMGKEVAVKMLKELPSLEEVRAFLGEMELMKSVGRHAHVAGLLGCCGGTRPRILVEYCKQGDLLSYLRRSWNILSAKRNINCNNNQTKDEREEKPKDQSQIVVNKLYDLDLSDGELTFIDLLSFCRQIAMGMEFLASNRVVHRDLAARNVLVTADKTLKIADFGLSRDVYEENHYKQKGNGKMPVKWMAPESLTHRIYTTQSDVWSFGVVMWEILTLGATPYPGVCTSRLPRLLYSGYRMPRPHNCTPELYEVMSSCWNAHALLRPSFPALCARVEAQLQAHCAGSYLQLELGAPARADPPRRRYLHIFSRGAFWSRDRTRYERPLKSRRNRYTDPPDTTAPSQSFPTQSLLHK